MSDSIPPRPTPIQRFASSVALPTALDGCWEWTAGRNNRGYAQYVTHGKNNVSGHRFAYEQFVGQIPAGLVLDHLCENRGCVNPAHLDPVTQSVNMLRHHHRRRAEKLAREASSLRAAA